VRPIESSPAQIGIRSWLNSPNPIAIMGLSPRERHYMTTPITIQCKSCEKSLSVPASLIGKKGQCPACKAEIRFMSPATPAPSSTHQLPPKSPSPIPWTVAPATQPVLRPTSAIPQRSTSDDMRALLYYQANARSAGIAYAFWFFLGMWGAHRFYCGKVGSAVAQLLITIISIPLCFVLIGLFPLSANAIWVLIDVFLISGWIRESNQRLAHLVAP